MAKITKGRIKLTLEKDGRIAIPPAIREFYGLVHGDQLIIQITPVKRVVS